MNWPLFFDASNLILTLMLIILTVKIVVNVENRLDKFFKMLLYSFFVLALASLLGINKYLGIIPENFSWWLLTVSRFFALSLTLMAIAIMLSIVRNEGGKKDSNVGNKFFAKH